MRSRPSRWIAAPASLLLFACDTPTGTVDGPVLTPQAAITSSSPVALVPVLSGLTKPVGIDHHEPSNRLVVSVNYSSGIPDNFRIVGPAGAEVFAPTILGFTDEVKIASVMDDGWGVSLAGFTPGDMFTGTGNNGHIALVYGDGSGYRIFANLGNVGLFRGGLVLDRTGLWAGDLITATNLGYVHRVNASGVATQVAYLGTHLASVLPVPDDPRYGPWAGKIVVGAPTQQGFYAIGPGGAPDITFYQISDGVNGFVLGEDMDLVPADRNLFTVQYSTGQLLGAGPAAFVDKVGDFIVTNVDLPGRLWHVRWSPGSSSFQADVVAEGDPTTLFEHTAFSSAGVGSIPPIEVNQAPVADAGEDRTVISTGTGANVTLDGSASYDPDGDGLIYSWSLAGVEIATGVSPTVSLPFGSAAITLAVSDGSRGARDEVVITTVEGAESSVGGYLRFADRTSFRISAQLRCAEVCTPSGSVGLRLVSNWINFDVADLQVTGGGLLPWSVVATSFERNQAAQPGDYAVYLDEIRPRDCEGRCEVTWTIEVAEVTCAPVCGLTPLYVNTGGTGRLALKS